MKYWLTCVILNMYGVTNLLILSAKLNETCFRGIAYG